MKIYNRVVLSIATGEVLEEDSFNYAGPVALAKGGGGGGGSSGAVSYPAYIETAHGRVLDHGGTDSPTVSIIQALNSAISSSPFTAASAFDPSTEVGNILNAATAFDTFVSALNHITDWQTAVTTASTAIDALIDYTYINADIAAYSDLLDDELNDNIIPAFESGMRDINAVNTSAFVMGKADIMAKKVRDVSKYGTELRTKLQYQRNEMIMLGVEGIQKFQLTRAELEKAAAAVIIEANRISIVANKEESDQNIAYDEADARWDIELFQHVANMFAGVGGGSVGTAGAKQPSALQSALGGALSGAAIGAQVGGPPGAAAGAFLGIGAGLLT